MNDDYIKNLDVDSAKKFLKLYRIEATDDEIKMLLPILKQNPDVIYNKQKRSVLLQTLPINLRNKILDHLNRYSL